MKKKLFQIGFILLLAILVSTGINFSLKKNQSNFSLGVANIEALATGEIDVNIEDVYKRQMFAVPVLFFIIIVNILIGSRSALYLLLSSTLLLSLIHI